MALLPMLCAPAAFALEQRRSMSGQRYAAAIAALEIPLFCAACLAPETTFVLPGVCGLGLSLVLDGFRILYAAVALCMWLGTLLLSGEYFAHHCERAGRYWFFQLMTLGATLGVFLASDLFTIFVFFEIMSFTSYEWVIHDETPGAMRAGGTYLAIAVVGGMTALMGLFLLWNTAGTLEISALQGLAASMPESRGTLWAAGICLLVGFGAKAGAFPLHIWLPKAHPVAPAPASALLSGILTKTGVLGALVLCAYIFEDDLVWGTMILSIGTITMVWGAVLALLSVNLKRTLACSSLSQIGFILVGAGMICLLGSHHNALAARGVLLHMMNHSLFKLLLFLCAGAVYMNAHTLDLNELRGWGRDKNLLKVLFLMGALGIGGFPGWSGYVSKTLLHESIVEYIVLLEEAGQSATALSVVEWLFLFSGGLTVAYMTKLFICLFVQKKPAHPAHENKPYMRPLSAAVLCVTAAIFPIAGMLPGVIMDGAADIGAHFLSHAHAHEVHYFAWINLKGAVISLSIGAATYLLIVRPLLMRPDGEGGREYVNIIPEWFDLEDRVYRPVLLKLLPMVLGTVCRFVSVLPDYVFAGLRIAGGSLARVLAALPAKVTGVITAAAGFLSRILMPLPDRCAQLIGQLIVHPENADPEVMEEEHFAVQLGLRLDRLHNAVHGGASEGGYAKALWRRAVRAYRRHPLTGSPSFALLMMCAGLAFMMLYLTIG